MMIQIVYTSLFLCGFLLILWACETLHKRWGVRAEYTRKTGHAASSIASIALIFLIDSHWYVLVLGILLFFLLYTGKRKNLFKSIDGVPRKTSGSYLLPVAIYLMFLFAELASSRLIFILPLLILGISDTLAGLANGWIRSDSPKSGKTLYGSAAFFISAMLISWITLHLSGYNLNMQIRTTLALALISTIAERYSHKGFDNLTVPLASGIVLWIFL
ncbi:MAG: hypothetical protein R6V49_07785 [Bacteroidales bacterium]